MDVTRLAELSEQIDDLTRRLAELAESPPAERAAAEVLLSELGRAERSRRSLLKKYVGQQSPDRPSGRDIAASATVAGARRTTSLPVRERALAALELLGVPTRGGLLAVAAEVRTGEPVVPRQLASLRRSELASWRSAPDRRPAYVVPALHIRRFEPIRGTLASSAWEPFRRLVGPLSPRADHLRATIRVAEHTIWARDHSQDVADRLDRLLWRLARSVPGVLEALDFDAERTVAAARAELAMIDDEDRSEREAAAVRLADLEPEQRLFGAGMRVVSQQGSAR